MKRAKHSKGEPLYFVSFCYPTIYLPCEFDSVYFFDEYHIYVRHHLLKSNFEIQQEVDICYDEHDA